MSALLLVVLTQAAVAPAPQGIASVATAPVIVDRVVARVNGQVITWRELHHRAQPWLDDAKSPDARRSLLRDVLDRIIADQLIAEDSARLEVSVADADIDAALVAVRDNARLSADELAAEVTKRGLSMADYRESLRLQLLEVKWLQRRVDRAAFPGGDDTARMNWLDRERQRLVEALKAESTVEVRL